MPRTASSDRSVARTLREKFDQEGHPVIPSTRLPSEREMLARLDAANAAEWEASFSRGDRYDRPRVGRHYHP